jgi:hypothetical protein
MMSNILSVSVICVSFGITLMGNAMGPKQVLGLFTRNIKNWPDDTNFVGRQKFKSFNFYCPTDFVLSD